ncbi:unnamed protein product [Dicrocoelium dendriticum]|nr:unnamed protein product [Dicrocoelium dendriticum]
MSTTLCRDLLPKDDHEQDVNGDLIEFCEFSSRRVNFSRASSTDTEEESWESDGEEDPIERPEFPEFESKLTEAIRALGGFVFPKLNWSSPKDASWMLCGNSMKCNSFSDVYLLLKASDFVAHDLVAPFALCTDVSVDQLVDKPPSFKHVLVLRRWAEMRPDGEFRCFVRENRLIAISQRICDAYFSSIATHADRIKQALCSFFSKRIHGKFPLDDYAVDLYCEFTQPTTAISGIKVVDFNVFGDPTEPLLFSWSELENTYPLETDFLPLFRYQEDRSIRPSVFKQYSVPSDLVDIASGSDPNKLMDFVQRCVEEQKK